MSKRPFPVVLVTLQKIVGGGQTLATMDDGRKLFVWGGLPTEEVEVQLFRKKNSFAEGYVINVLKPAKDRIEALDQDSYISTSPWQIMAFASEQRHKAELIKEAFDLHHFKLPKKIEVYSDDHEYGYRNKMEFSWYWDKAANQLDLAFYGRGTHSKIPVAGSHLAMESINKTALAMRDLLRAHHATGFSLKTLLVRANQKGDVAMQLYVKSESFKPFREIDIAALGVKGFEVIYSNPKSPASVITKRLQAWGSLSLTDTINNVPFSYLAESFFQINLPVYEQALMDMHKWVDPAKPTVDLYSGVGTIGLTIGADDLTLVEINEAAVCEMKANIERLKMKHAHAVHAPSEKALDFISGNATIIVDPPRAGLDKSVINRLIEAAPARIIYLSCNPVTQARDIALLAESYSITSHRGYNFFPRTPHIEHLVVLDLT
ncbi:MAG: class I SAM-dependent RNA methyltransferase [Candidatus Microsaccharimonas sossegonensis]|uniref:Class I SAM-dependent RNA methyltransferase n=1 Tax=Candidatus Microsaccharimonas sossegonensis TaxID=2506948 RepID=A0A4Q0AIK5_9BACT|nr:MAG: class I SAM-dependent RNA methyltransferase [Candidatus Microsaccharimonas sossegonensis]